MGIGAFDVRWKLANAGLVRSLQTLTETSGANFLCSELSLPLSEPLGTDCLLVCDAGLIDIEAVRAAAPKAVLIAVLPENTYDYMAEEVFELADEVLFAPVSPVYAKRRFSAALKSLQDHRQACLTRIYLDAVIDNSPDLIWFKDLRGAHLKVNEAFCEAVGKTRQQVEGRGHYYIWDIAPDEYACGEFVCLETEEIVLNRRTRCLFDEKVQCKQGLRQFKTYKAPLIDDGGDLLGTVGVAQDITRHLETTSRLSERVANITAAIDTSGMYQWCFNPQTHVARLGHAFTTELGLPGVLENYPQCLVERGIIHSDSVENYLAVHHSLQVNRRDGSYDVHLCLPDGAEVWKRVRYSYNKLENGEGEFQGIGEDITDYKSMENCLVVAARNNGITTWIYDIQNKTVHSIIDPLNALGWRQGGVVQNVPDVFAGFPRLHPEDLEQVMLLHSRIAEGEDFSSAVVRWKRPGTEGWSWFRLCYTAVRSSAAESARAIGSALDISEQVKAEHRYAMQVAYRDSSARLAHGTMLLNLTRNTVSESGGRFAGKLQGSVDEIFENVATRTYLKDFPEIGAFFDRKRLLENFNKHITLERQEHPYRSADDEDVIWVLSTVNTIRNPDTGDVEAFIQVKNIDEQKVMAQCFRAASVQDNESLVCVDLRKGTFRVICRQGQLAENTTRTVQRNYADEVLDLVSPGTPEPDCEAFRESMKLETVGKRLADRNHYVVNGVVSGAEGMLHRKRVCFTWMDRPRGLVCMTVSDAAVN